MGLAKASIAFGLALVAVISLFAVPAKAVDRSDGDYWVYEGGMDFEGISVSGTFRYEFSEADTISIGSESYDVNVIRVTGSMSGETDDFLGITASVEMVYSGFTYELDGSLASVKEDMYLWANMTIGTGSLALVTRVETQDVTTYSPPPLSGFVDGETGTGDEWDETTNVTTTSTTWVDGAIDETSTDEYEETYSFSVGASEESVDTVAGTFDCLRITMTGAEGDYDQYWYSSEVGSWVKISMYELGDSDPYMSVELSEYSHDSGYGVSVLLPWIILMVVVVVIIVVIALVMRKRGKAQPVAPQQMPPPPPPA